MEKRSSRVSSEWIYRSLVFAAEWMNVTMHGSILNFDYLRVWLIPLSLSLWKFRHFPILMMIDDVYRSNHSSNVSASVSQHTKTLSFIANGEREPIQNIHSTIATTIHSHLNVGFSDSMQNRRKHLLCRSVWMIWRIKYQINFCSQFWSIFWTELFSMCVCPYS